MPNVSHQDGIIIVELDETYDSLDDQGIDVLSDTLLDEVQRAEQPRLVVDMHRTRFIGSRAIGVMLQAWKRVRQRGGHMVVAGPQKDCAEVLRVFRLDTIWDIVPDRQQALALVVADTA